VLPPADAVTVVAPLVQPPSAPAEPTPAPGFEIGDSPPDVVVPEAPPAAEPLGAPAQPEVVYVPMAVTIGDGFKFGCGFFLASVLAALVGFVLLAALFLLMGIFGLNVPLGR
jgi:hypothetical protein